MLKAVKIGLLILLISGGVSAVRAQDGPAELPGAAEPAAASPAALPTQVDLTDLLQRIKVLEEALADTRQQAEQMESQLALLRVKFTDDKAEVKLKLAELAALRRREDALA